MKNKLPRLIILASALVALMVYIYPHPTVSHYKYEQGSPWNYADLMAPFDLDIMLDSVTRNTKIDSVQREFIPFFSTHSVNIDSLTRLAATALTRAADNTEGGDGFISVPRTKLFIEQMKRTVRHAYAVGIISDADAADLQTIRVRKSETDIEKCPVADLYTPRRLFAELTDESSEFSCRNVLMNSHIDNLFPPSLTMDEDLNELYLEQEKSKFIAPIGRIITGQKIIGKGEIVTAQNYTNLQNYEKKLARESGMSSRSDLLMTLGQLVYIALLTLLFILYVYIYEPRVFNSFKTMAFLLGLVALFFAIQVAVTWLVRSDSGAYLVPLAVVPILIQVFFNGRLALAAGTYLILLCGGLTNYPLEFIFVQSVAMVAGVLSLKDLTERLQLLKTSAIVTVTLWAAYSGINIMTNGSFEDFSLRMVGALTVSGALTAMAYILMSLVERTFGFISNVTLVELADTNTPLLRQLSDECPGTFQHCVAVSNLAGDAARLIGANVLLTRAGALYHDIGKLTNPVFFTENQHGVNPHDGLAPQKSAEIIISHVTEGLKRADRAGLPSVIKDFISQHHGAGKAKYFYITACRQNPDSEVDPAPYTYPGPNPRTREASVLMMADAVEAASRSLKDYSPENIRELVNRIIDGQISEGLHNDSSLSFRDVSIIKDAFSRRLMTIYHSRIAYPDAPKPA